jgi:isopenicillin N synthase-like dioxygenase
MTDLVPVIDLNAPDAVNQIDQACRSVGFLSIVGHGVPQDVTQRMVAATAEFFALPLDGKLGLRPPNPAVNRGYTAKGSEGLIYSLGVEGTPPDLFEAFNIGPDSWPAGDPVYEAERERIFAANIWPDHPTDLRPALVDYFDEMRRLAHRLTRLFALALGLEPDFFDDKTDHSTDTLRVLNYERAAGEPEPVEG